MDKGNITLYLDRDDINRLSDIARTQDTSPSRIIRQLVRDYLAQHQSARKSPAKTKRGKL